MNPTTPPSLPPAMDPEQQRIAIAEACGWTKTLDSWFEPNGGAWARWVDRHGALDQIPDEQILPDYLHSLDAMHEAEKVLTEGQKMTFRRWLSNGATMFHEHAEKVCHATAAQRAEAFLRTLNLWTPTK